MIIILAFLAVFVAGLITGWRLTWWRMQRVWLRNPYAFKSIVDEVIEKRIKEGRLQPLEEDNHVT